MKLTLPSSQTISTEKDYFTTIWYTFFNNSWKRLLGKFQVFMGGVIDNNFTSTSSVGSSSDLMSYIIKKNTLSTNGDFLEIEAFGIFESNANNKSISLEFGSTELYTITPTSLNGGSWSLKTKIIRTSDLSQEIIVDGNGTNSVLIKTVYMEGSEDLTSDLIFKVIATGTTDNDVVQKSLTTKIYSQ